jgi:arylsulfatase A-like enzyme
MATFSTSLSLKTGRKSNIRANSPISAPMSSPATACNSLRNNTEQPFFLIASYYNPHSPYIAAPRHRETFRAGAGWDWEPHRPPNFNPTDLRDKPNYVQELKQTPPDVLDTANLQILRSLLSVDDGVASIMNILEQTGLDENTIVFFLSDNGMTVGEHGFGVDKNCPYDECIRVPFIVHAPAATKRGRMPAWWPISTSCRLFCNWPGTPRRPKASMV